MRRARVARFLLIALLLTSVATAAAAEAQEGAEPADAAAEEVAEPVPLDCKPAELYENVESWSVDCVAQWLENLGFGAQRQQAAAPRRAPGGSCRAPPLTTDVPCARS